MRLTRRRFLTIAAAMAATPAWATRHSWQGRALGAEVSLTIRGPRDLAEAAIAGARAELTRIERLFSLYDPASALSRLNRSGVLHHPDPLFVDLMQQAGRAYDLTGGLFDPTVQPLWQAHATGGDVAAAQARVGWARVSVGPEAIRLASGQALTLNGIAQGFATDRVTAHLTALGLSDLLVNIGEYRGVGGPWRLGLTDPVHGDLGMQTLKTGAIATSSPGALQVGEAAHILHPAGPPHWSTVSVQATTATLADGLSTALCLAPYEQVVGIREHAEVARITLVDFAGDLSTI